MSERRLTCYLVGGGYMSATHMACYIQNPSVEVLGVIDPNENKGRKLAAEHGVEWFKDIKSAFSYRSADFCDVCLPSFLHKDATIAAIEHGADVICEKPFSRLVEDAEEMMEAAAKHGRRLTVAHVCRFMPQYYKAKEILDSGRLGRPLYMSIMRESETPMWSVGNWLFDMDKSGGTILDLSIHDIDIVLWFFGRPESAQAMLIEKKEMPGLGVSVSSLSFKDGPAVDVTANHLLPRSHSFDTSFHITLTEGYIEYSSFMPGKLSVWDSYGHSEIDLSIEEGFADAYKHELDSFVRAELDGSPFMISAEEAAEDVRIGCELIRTVRKSIL